jgi:hypothetical protein
MSGITVDQPTDAEIEDWWTWLLSFSQVQSPLGGGNNVGRGNPRSSWCCACTGGRGGNGGIDNNDRNLPIGRDLQKAVLIPVLTTANCKEELRNAGNLAPTDEDARNSARSKVEPPNSLKCVIKTDNGNYNITPTDDSLIESGPFPADTPANNILDAPALQASAQKGLLFYSAGYWLKLNLPRGNYTVNFGGRKGSFNTEVTYRITP